MDKIAEILALVDVYQFICEAKKLKKVKKVFGPYLRPDKRKIIIVHYVDGSKRTISYPKYLMEQHLQKELDPNKCTIDHLDFDKNNNDLSNLRIVPRDQHSADDTRRVINVKLVCPMCQKEFERSPRLIRDKSKKGVSGAFCSRQCSGKYNRQLQLGLIDKLDTPEYVESKYYRRKNVQAMSDYLIQKYGSLIS